MPESLAFAAPTPAFVYANVFFDAAVSVVNDHNTRITGVRKPLVLALRFHDTYDVVDEQDAILEPDRGTSLTVDPATGVCQLRVRLKTFTATCDGRTFCIEARAADSDAEPAFSTPITVVKEKLAIVQQPPDVWFKDEGGREKCMAITLVLEPAPGAVIEDRVIPLDVRLLYESGNAVLNQSILRLFPDMRPNMTRGRVTISFRIDDVSKNHQGQSFVLEVSPERQDSSSMFQDIAPTRTSVIAIRSKRNKRKLNAASHSVAAGSATRASPRSVAGTPRTNLMMMPQPHAHVGQSPMAQQPRPRKMATMAYGMMGAQQQLPPSGRSNEMQQMTWSSHVMATTGMGGMQQVATPMQSPAAATPQHHQHQQQQQMVAEWKLAAFEIHPDGSVNTARPIYRCPQCRRMNDMDMMSANAAEHSPQCVFFAGGSAYRSQVEGAALQAQQQQQQQQVQQYQQYQQSPMNSAPARSTPMMMSAQTAAMVDAQQNTVNISGISTSAGPGAFGLDVPANTSPKTLAALMQSSTQRPTISPYMNKVTAGTETPPGGSADAPSPATIASQLQPQEAGSAAGNLFASTAFRSQMEMEETATSAPLADKLTFLNKPGDEDGDPARDDLLYPGGGMPQESPSTAFVVGIGSALFNEMTSMGINLDQFDKVDAVGGAAALGDFTSMAGETTEEDQVYYILASMYTDAQSRKLGLPAFDQFQRMLGFYNEAQNDVGTQVVFHSLLDVGLSDKETVAITSNFMEELERGADAVHSLPKYQHNLILLREDALMYYWSQSLV